MPYKNSEDCSHSNIHDEIFSGQRTGEFKCSGCGECWTSWEAVEDAQEAYKRRHIDDGTELKKP